MEMAQLNTVAAMNFAREMSTAKGPAEAAAFGRRMLNKRQFETLTEQSKETGANGDNPHLKQFAQNTLPVLQQHLQMAQRGHGPAGPVGGPRTGRVVVQEPAPAVRVEQAAPQVTVQQPQPQVSVREPQPEITVRMPPPTITDQQPQPDHGAHAESRGEGDHAPAAGGREPTAAAGPSRAAEGAAAGPGPARTAPSPACPASALVGQIRQIEEGSVSGSS